MKRIALLVLGLLLFGAADAGAQVSRFTGDWVNVSSSSGGIAALRVTATGSGVDVRAWGKCSPANCDWGTRPGFAYSTSPATTPTTGARAVTVVFTTGFNETTLVITPYSEGRIQVQRFVRFTDGSGRSPYTQRDILRPR